MMKILSKTDIWENLSEDLRLKSNSLRIQRLIMRTGLYRAYAAIDTRTNKLMLLLEIPEKDRRYIDKFIEPDGLSVWTENSGQEKNGFVTCVISSTDVSKNDIFKVIADDIAITLIDVSEANQYTQILWNRLEKWKSFFKSKRSMLLSEKEIIGLIGEISFISELIDNNIQSVIEMWNGPIKASQDFQTEKVGIEIKTTTSSLPKEISISNIAQLDVSTKDRIFISLYQVERNSHSGKTLPELIKEVERKLDPSEISLLVSKLLCCGYFPEHEQEYKMKYLVRKNHLFDVVGGFPRLTSDNTPLGITNCKYFISLDSCEPYKVDLSEVLQALGG